MSSESVIVAFKSQFVRFEIPYSVFSDSVTQLKSINITKFANTYGFEHITSSAKYSQSNGLVEKHIGTIKKMFKKLDEEPFVSFLSTCRIQKYSDRK